MITGCRGQVGHSLVKQFEGKAELLAVDSKQLDITQEDAVKKMVAGFKPNYIINAAAYTAVDKAEEDVDSSFAVNKDGPRFLAEAAKEHNAVILHISTDYVFDGNSAKPYNEGDLATPQSVYGMSKYNGEEEVAIACRKHLILRTSWVFSEHGNNFVKTMLKLGSEREALSVVGDQVGGPTYAGDIAAALKCMVDTVELKKEVLWGVYHFSGVPYVTWYEFAQNIFKIAEENKLFQIPELSSIPTSEYPTLAERPANSRLNCLKIDKQFAIKPSDWKKALKNIKTYK